MSNDAASPTPAPTTDGAQQPTLTVIRTDEWANPGTGMGIAGVDNRTGWVPFTRTRNQRHLRDLWLGDGLGGRIVELPADEMTREGGEVNLGDGEEYEEPERLIRAHLDEANVWAKLAKAKKFERAYGGGALIMSIEDGMPWDQPVDVNRILSVKGLIPATPDQLQAVSYYDDPARADTCGRPALYRWQPGSLRVRLPGGGNFIHESRVIAFTGLEVDDERLVENLGWGDSVLGRCEERLRDTASALAGVGVALQNFSQDVISMLNLAAELAKPDGMARVQNRVRHMRIQKSMLGAVLIDTQEQFTRQGIPMAGVADALTQFANFLSATTGMPVPILMGYSAVGLGDTSATLLRVWHDWLRAEQKNSIRPALNKYLRLLLRAKRGPTGGIEPDGWSVVFAPLERPTAAEEDQRRKNQMEIDKGYTEMQVYGPGDIARSRFKGPTGFSTATDVDLTVWAPLPEAEPVDPAEPTETEPVATEPVATEPEPVIVLPTEATPTPAARPSAGPEAASDTALNGAQVKSAQELVTSVAEKKLPRSSGVAMLVRFFNLSPEAAEEVMGDVGRTFFIGGDGAPGETEPSPPARADAYAAVLAQEPMHGGLSMKQAQREVARVLDVSTGKALAFMRRAPRVDAADVTNFPRPGADKTVGFKASRWPLFDVAYAQELKENWPEVWGSGGNLIGNTQFDRLLPMARAGEDADTAVEEHALRLREAWAHANAERSTPKAVVAMVKQLVVGRMGEAAMRRVLEAEKERVRKRRAAGG